MGVRIGITYHSQEIVRLGHFLPSQHWLWAHRPCKRAEHCWHWRLSAAASRVSPTVRETRRPGGTVELISHSQPASVVLPGLSSSRLVCPDPIITSDCLHHTTSLLGASYAVQRTALYTSAAQCVRCSKRMIPLLSLLSLLPLFLSLPRPPLYLFVSFLL